MHGRTTFIVAHRLSTLRNADRILVVDGGEVVGIGPHEALLKSCPVYQRMWETQQVGDGRTPPPATKVGRHDEPIDAFGHDTVADELQST